MHAHRGTHTHTHRHEPRLCRAVCVQHLDQGVAATAGRREDEDEHASRREPEARVVVDEVPQHELVCGGRLWGATVQWYVRHARGCYAYAVRTVRGASRQAAPRL